MFRVVAIGLLAVLMIASVGSAVNGPDAPIAETPAEDPPVGPQPCTPGAGCMPIYVDETGDRMTGTLEMLGSWIGFPNREDGICLGCIGPQESDTFGPMQANNESRLTGDLALLNMPINVTNIISLLNGSKLNATAGGTIFIDLLGNLTFADGSWMNNDGSFFNHATVYNQTVIVQGNGSQLIVSDGADLVFDDAGGILTTNGTGRVGTTGNHPFRIIVNNETAFLFVPGASPNLIGGYGGNNATAGLIGVIIAGGGAQGAQNNAAANFTSILGGTGNLASGIHAVVLGGQGNTAAGDHATAAGTQAGALHDGSFVWADSTGAPFNSSADHQFLVRAAGGVGINTTSPVSALTVEGDITPATNDAHALGSPTHRWDQLFMASEIDYASDLLYTNNGVLRMTLTTGGTLHVPGTVNATNISAAAYFGDGSGLTGVVATELAPGAVTADTIADGAVTPAKLADCATGQVLKHTGSGWTCSADAGTTYTAGDGIALTDTTFSIADGGVTSDKIAADAVTSAHLGVAAVGTDEIGDAAVTLQKLAPVCLSAEILKFDGMQWTCATDNRASINAGEGLILSGSTLALADDGVTAAKIANGTIGSADINASQVQVRIGDTCTPGAFITGINADGTIECASDADTTYTAGEGLALAGTTFSLADLAVTSAKLATGAVTTDKIAADAVTSEKIADGAVHSDHILDNEVRSEDIHDGTIGLMDIDILQIQQRVSTSCAPGAAIRVIDAEGVVTCEADDDTTYAAGSGLTLAGTTFHVPEAGIDSTHIAPDAIGGSQVQDGTLTGADVQDGTLGFADVVGSEIQARVTGMCGSGLAISSVLEDGSVTCNTLSNAQTLDGLDSESFLRSDAADTYTGSGLRIAGTGDLIVDNDFQVGSGSALGDDLLFFDDGVSEYLMWDDAPGQFVLSDDLNVQGALAQNGASVCTMNGDCPGTGDVTGVMRILDAFGAEAGRQALLPMDSSICWVDDDADATIDHTESVYIQVGDDNCEGSVGAGDIRLRNAGGFAVYSRVTAADADFGDLTSFGTATSGAGLRDTENALLWNDANGDNRFKEGDGLYVDVDDSGTVSVGDIRLNFWSSFAAGTTVLAGHADIGNPLRESPAVNFDQMVAFWDVDWDGLIDGSDPLYFDMDGDGRTSGGDFRVNSIEHLV